MESTRDTPLTAASPAVDTIAESTIPAIRASTASKTIGIVSATSARFENIGL